MQSVKFTKSQSSPHAYFSTRNLWIWITNVVWIFTLKCVLLCTNGTKQYSLNTQRNKSECNWKRLQSKTNFPITSGRRNFQVFTNYTNEIFFFWKKYNGTIKIQNTFIHPFALSGEKRVAWSCILVLTKVIVVYWATALR